MAEKLGVNTAQNPVLPCYVCALMEGGIQIPFLPVQTVHVELRVEKPPEILLACVKCRTVKAMLRSELS